MAFFHLVPVKEGVPAETPLFTYIYVGKEKKPAV